MVCSVNFDDYVKDVSATKADLIRVCVNGLKKSEGDKELKQIGDEYLTGLSSSDMNNVSGDSFSETFFVTLLSPKI